MLIPCFLLTVNHVFICSIHHSYHLRWWGHAHSRTKLQSQLYCCWYYLHLLPVEERWLCDSRWNWTISLLPANCGSPLPLLAIADASREGNSDAVSATYTKDGLNSSVQVKREQEASPPVEGTFDIIYNGITITGGYYVTVHVRNWPWVGSRWDGYFRGDVG